MTVWQGRTPPGNWSQEGLSSPKKHGLWLLLPQTSLRCFGSWEAWTGLGRSLRQSFLIPMLCQWSKIPTNRREDPSKICSDEIIRPCSKKIVASRLCGRRSTKRVIRFWYFAGSSWDVDSLLESSFARRGFLTIFFNANNALSRGPDH